MKEKQHFFKTTFLFLLLVLFALSSNAQTRNITGKVTDESGLGIPGASIVVKGTTTGTVSDMDGNYSLNVAADATVLAFSFIGMEQQDIEIGNQTTINVTLKASTFDVDEVVVVGYGTQKKSDITGAVASISSDRLEQVPNVNFAQALQGAIPGISITSNAGGAEGGDMSIMIRGRNSIEAGNRPLIVLDGIPYGGSISEINPEDIKSIEVLKDASSAAIYGARGSNGVILITTKKGKIGKPMVSYSGYYGTQQISNMPDYLTGPEFYDYKNIREPESMSDSEQEVYDAGTWTNWSDLTMRTGEKQQHSVSISGGTDNINYFVSGTYLDVKGIAIGDDFKRYSTRFNFEAKITDWFTIGSNTQLSLADRSGKAPNWNGGHEGAFWNNPLSKAYDEEGEQNIYPWPEETYWGNPLAPLLADDKDKRYQVFTNNFVKIDIPFIPGLQYKLNSGVEYTNRERNEYYGRNTRVGLEVLGASDTRNRIDNNYLVENILSYKKEIGEHNIFLTGLYSYQSESWEQNRVEAQGFPSDDLGWTQGVANMIELSTTHNEQIILSQMLRANYSYDSRYLVTVTGRRDGFSGFGADYKWGLFPSVAVGWNIANESFMEGIDIIDQLKLRASWGENGNQAVGAYESLNRYRDRHYLNGSMTAAGYILRELGKPDLRWEHTAATNIGIDFALLNGRISGSLDAFNTNTKDLLLDRIISSVHGVGRIVENIGKTNNKGIEMGLNAHIVSTPDFKWTASGTVSFVKNKIVSLYGELDEDGNEIDDLGNRWFIGQPIRVNFARVNDGVWQTDDDIANSAQPDAEPGFIKIKDIGGDFDEDGNPIPDGMINDDDLIIQGQQDPKMLWSLTNKFSYKGFTLSAFFHGVTGVTKRNYLMADDVWIGVMRNTMKKNWWTPENPTNEYVANHIDANKDGGRWYEDASFIRLKDVSLSYDLSSKIQKKLGFSKLRVYVAGRNLMTITKYNGLDPELTEFNTSGTISDDTGRAIPLQKEYMVGLILGF
jgi:TonB-linked SusC/RagA family outer membrane protein